MGGLSPLTLGKAASSLIENPFVESGLYQLLLSVPSYGQTHMSAGLCSAGWLALF
jgi:hypothetical protein